MNVIRNVSVHLRRMSRRRAFSLVIALMLGVVTAAVAVGLVAMAGASQVGIVHTAGGDLAKQIADAGMQRVTAYAHERIAPNADFDLLLDPSVEANCTQLTAVTNTGVVAETGNMNLPRFTDSGATNVTWSGKRYKLIPYNGGAYLARYDDDDDDSIVNASWTPATTTTGATTCKEGPVSIFGINNPARDRNRTVMATVIGIYPGTNPATAVHRTVLRKMIVDPLPVTAKAGMQTGGNFEADSVIHFCSTIAGVAASGEVQKGGAGTCYCGDVSKAKSGLVQCATCCGSTNPLNPDTSTIPPAPPAVSPTAAKWYDWTSECNFYMRSGVGLFWWDADAARGTGATCGAYTGAVVLPSLNSDTDGSCWTPIFTYAGGVFATPIVELGGGGTQEVVTIAAGTYEWRPRAAEFNYDLTTYYTSGTRTETGKKPNWSICPDTANVDFKWDDPTTDPGSGAEDIGCTSCDGVDPTVKLVGGATWRFNQAAANLNAYPVGVYHHSGNLSWVQEGAAPATPAAQSPASNTWPMITLVVGGSLSIGAGDTALFGAGTRKNDFAGLVASGISMNGGVLAVAGSAFTSNYNASGGHSWHWGRIESNGNIHFEASSIMDWIYNYDLAAASVTPVDPPHMCVGLSL